jgi:TatA/E family protein of Tat protein translocase
MFGIGAGELLVMLALALVIVGPQKLPELGRTVGKAVNEFRVQTAELRSVMSFDPPPTTPATSHFPGAQSYGAAAERLAHIGGGPEGDEAADRGTSTVGVVIAPASAAAVETVETVSLHTDSNSLHRA